MILQTLLPMGAPARSNSRLVLSLFPGAGLLDRGFELEGWLVLRGPDILWGQPIESFTASAGSGAFAGVIGGPPCQDFSRARRAPPTGNGVRMLREFCRVVSEVGPDWFLMENVPGVPAVQVPGFQVQRLTVFASSFGLNQRRNRCFQFGSRDGFPITLERLDESRRATQPAVLARDGRRCFADLCELQGLPRDFNLPGLSKTAKYRAVGNGVPVPVARAVAAAIRERGRVVFALCPCGCGRPISGRQRSATVACRKRLERGRRASAAGIAATA